MTLDALSILTRLIQYAEGSPDVLAPPQEDELRDLVVGEAEELLRELQDRSVKALRSVTLLQRLEAWANEHDADVSIASTPKREWMVMMHFGREAPDSPMYAGSRLGADKSLERAIEQALGETRAPDGARVHLPVTLGSAAVPEGSDQIEVALFSTDGRAWQFELGPVAAGTFALTLHEAKEELERKT